MCNNNFCWKCGSFSASTAYHLPGVPCVEKAWWTGPLCTDKGNQHVVPGILQAEDAVRAAAIRLQDLQDAVTNKNAAGPLGYASGLSIAAIIQQECNVREANLLIMHTLVHYQLKQGTINPQVHTALDVLRAYVANMRAFLTDRSFEPKRMKILRKQFQQKPRRFVDHVRQLRDALPSFMIPG